MASAFKQVLKKKHEMAKIERSELGEQLSSSDDEQSLQQKPVFLKPSRD